VSCSCTSPDGVSVSIENWTSSRGTVSGSGSTGTLNTAGVAPGIITIFASCVDVRGLNAKAETPVTVQNPPPVVNKQLEVRLALRSVYFPTAQPTEKNPTGGLAASQKEILQSLATDFKKYLEAKPDAHLTLEGHADVRGSVPYNQALSLRRVFRVQSFLVENGVPENKIETKAMGAQHNLTAAEVNAAVAENPELTTEEKVRLLRKSKIVIWASNRRVDITLSTAGRTETSLRQYPFNAADSLTLIGGREGAKTAPAKKPAKKSVTK
jgi:outer membrane protein OmpA-like peptidoglycan-associated protein